MSPLGLPWKTLTDPLPKDDVKKLAVELENRLSAIESNFDELTGAIGSPTFRRLYIADEEAVTSTSYSALGTPDQVTNVPMPNGGMICVVYGALWKSSVAGEGRAAIFLNGNQLKRRTTWQNANPVVQEASMTAPIGGYAADANEYVALYSIPAGLQCNHGAAASANAGSDVTTGQSVAGERTTTDNAGDQIALMEGGACMIFAAAGMYTVSVQFKSASGSVTAKERKLTVWTVGAASGQSA